MRPNRSHCSKFQLILSCYPVLTKTSQRNCPTPGSNPSGPPVRGGRGGFAGGAGGFRGGYGGGGGGAPRAAPCYQCGGPNHYARDCQAQAIKCYACGKLGHISRDCNAPNGGPLTDGSAKTCYRCGEAGHISRECPQLLNGGAEADASVAGVPPTAPAAAV
jgi:hypothetical protein